MNFPITNTRVAGLEKVFDLEDSNQRKEYFQAKIGNEIKKLQEYLKEGKSFIAFLIGKKNSGKGTYSKAFIELMGPGANVGHLSVGDIVRDIHAKIEKGDEKAGEKADEKAELMDFLRKNYRGFHNMEEIEGLITGRSQTTLIPSELIVALIRYEISKRPRQALFIDGFPRAHDQIGYSMYLKLLVGYEGEPDFFVFIDLPNTVIDERIKYRVVCPVCKTPRNLKLLATKDVGYDKEQEKFYLMCDNPACQGARMQAKEGDELGIEPIRARLEVDDQIFKRLLELAGAPKIYLRNALPVSEKDKVDEYELTPEYKYEYHADTGAVETKKDPWVIGDDQGVPSYSLLPPAVVVSLVRQMVQVLGL